GMNFDAMPELHWAFGYPFAILLMAVVCGPGQSAGELVL
ncbi:CorA family divalent cation transporter, partial [Streptomyces roseoverticillatus]